MVKNQSGQLSIVLTDDAVKIAHLKGMPNNAEVANLFFREIKGMPDDEIAGIVAGATASFGLRRPEAICVLSSSLVTTKNIEIPSLDPKEIASIIELQAGRHTPYSREEIIIGYINFGIYQKNYSKVLLAIVNRKVVMRQVDILENSGVRVVKVLFGPEVRAGFYAQTLSLDAEPKPTGILDVDAFSTDFTITLRGTAIACRNIPIGVRQLSEESPGSYERFISEFKQSLDSYQSEDIEQLPGEYILSDAGDDQETLKEALLNTLSIGSRIVRYTEKISLADAAKQVLITKRKVTFLDVVAPLLTADKAQIDFLPDEIRVQRSLEEQGREGVKFGALILVFLVVIGFMVMSKLYFKGALLEKIKAEYTGAQDEAKKLEEVSTKTRLVKAYLMSRLMPLEAVTELYRIIPNDVYLNSLVIDEKGKISIDGTSDSMSQVFALVGSLENSELFKGVKTKSTTAKKERGKDVAAFEIVFKLQNAVDNGAEDAEDAISGEKSKAPVAGETKAEEDQEK